MDDGSGQTDALSPAERDLLREFLRRRLANLSREKERLEKAIAAKFGGEGHNGRMGELRKLVAQIHVVEGIGRKLRLWPRGGETDGHKQQ